MSTATSISVVRSQDFIPSEENRGEWLEPAPWTVQQNGQSKIDLHTCWVEAFQKNVDKVAEAVANSFYNHFSKGLDSTTKSGFTAYPTSQLPFRESYQFFSSS